MSSEGASWAQRGAIAISAGDLATARRCFRSAVKRDNRNARLRFQLALIHQALGELTLAAEQYTVALRFDATMQSAALRLCESFAQGVLKIKPDLDELGLVAALAFQSIDRDLLCAAAMHYLASTHPLCQILEQGRRDGWDSIARNLCLARTHDFLKNPLFLELLRKGIVCSRDIECLLIGIRRILLLELPPARLQDDALCRFMTALLCQLWNNEFVWLESDEERRQLAAVEIAPDELRAGNADACSRLFLKCLYRPARSQIEDVSIDQLGAIVPAVFQQALIERIAEETEIRERGERVPVVSEMSDDISRLVAGQYDVSPYPRWTSVPIFPNSGYIDHIRPHFKHGQLAFAQHPFEVLIAGCGTGRQAVSAALDYGRNAHVVGIDIARSSLGYASLMAERMGVQNVTLARGDLNAILDFEPTFIKRFQIVECTGVLHHMANPFAAWQRLITCLAPGGIMLIGLYSSTARLHLQTLKREADYPGADADVDALRAYRHRMFSRSGQWQGEGFLRSRDAFSTSGFRDFFLHVNEHTTDLIEIKAFLAENGLEFRGFVGPPIEALRQTKTDAAAPGDLADWAEWERQHPSAFTGMYQFWCTRT